MSRSIFDDYGHLWKILESHEAVLQKRWLKKTQAQRKKILLTAWPSMSASHNPHYRAFGKESEEQCRRELSVEKLSFGCTVHHAISLPKRAFKVFITIFHNLSKEDQQGEILWTDFLHTMSVIDFAPEKLYGSVWQFTLCGLGHECRAKHPILRTASGEEKFPFGRRGGSGDG